MAVMVVLLLAVAGTQAPHAIAGYTKTDTPHKAAIALNPVRCAMTIGEFPAQSKSLLTHKKTNLMP